MLRLSAHRRYFERLQLIGFNRSRADKRWLVESQRCTEPSLKLRDFAVIYVASCSPGRAPSRHLLIRAADPNSERTGGEGTKGVVPGLAQWPPKPITEHGQPKPEDDPKNFAAECVLHKWLIAASLSSVGIVVQHCEALAPPCHNRFLFCHGGLVYV